MQSFNSAGLGCDDDLTTSNGAIEIRSDDTYGAGDYPNNAYCKYQITATPGWVPLFTITEFSLNTTDDNVKVCTCTCFLPVCAKLANHVIAYLKFYCSSTLKPRPVLSSLNAS